MDTPRKVYVVMDWNYGESEVLGVYTDDCHAYLNAATEGSVVEIELTEGPPLPGTHRWYLSYHPHIGEDYFKAWANAPGYNALADIAAPTPAFRDPWPGSERDERWLAIIDAPTRQEALEQFKAQVAKARQGAMSTAG